MAWVLKAHPSFEKDLKKLSKADRERLTRLIFKIKEDPARFKPLKGFHKVFRIRFSGFRLVYALKGEIIWLIIVEAQLHNPVMVKSNIITINTYLFFNVMILPALDHGNNIFHI